MKAVSYRVVSAYVVTLLREMNPLFPPRMDPPLVRDKIMFKIATFVFASLLAQLINESIPEWARLPVTVAGIVVALLFLAYAWILYATRARPGVEARQ